MNDGNEDFRWNRGAIFTTKGSVEIWAPIAPITHEDLRHMRERVREFQCVSRIQQRPGGVCAEAAEYNAAGTIAGAMVRPATASQRP